MQKCPYPGCNYVADLILNHHAKTHGYSTKKELCKEHGSPKEVVRDAKKLKYASQKSNQLYESSFNNIDSALARMRRK